MSDNIKPRKSIKPTVSNERYSVQDMGGKNNLENKDTVVKETKGRLLRDQACGKCIII